MSSISPSSLFKVIGFSGKLGTGKDYIIRNYFVPYLKKNNIPFLILGFADQIKVTGMAEHNLDPEKVFGVRDDKTRATMQALGTELGRNVKGKDIWVRYMKSWMDLHYHHNGINVFICNDVRFIEELEFIQSMKGKIIRIHAPIRNYQRIIAEKISSHDHSSETALDTYKKFDEIIYNDPDNLIKIDPSKFL